MPCKQQCICRHSQSIVICNLLSLSLSPPHAGHLLFSPLHGNCQSSGVGLMRLCFFCSNIFTLLRHRFKTKCHDMPLFMVLDWKLYQWRSWRQYHAFTRKVLGRFMSSNSVRGVLLPVLSWAPTPYLTIMGCILLHPLQWLLVCPRHSFQMVLASTAMDMWMVQLHHGSTIFKNSVVADFLMPIWAFICLTELGDISIWRDVLFELFLGILTDRTVGTLEKKKKNKTSQVKEGWASSSLGIEMRGSESNWTNSCRCHSICFIFIKLIIGLLKSSVDYGFHSFSCLEVFVILFWIKFTWQSNHFTSRFDGV